MKTVREIRKETGLTQAEFAKKHEIPLRTLQSWELGERVPAAYIVTMLAKLVELEKPGSEA